ncbi:MAG: hypothetical protein NC400_02720 [Clostridium sp.]|nr:hypothetical protein [Clostridium sp.]
MRINSGTIGMESARSYSSISGRVSRLVITNGRQSLKDGTGTLLGNTLNNESESEAAEAKKGEGQKNSKGMLWSAFDGMNSRTSMFTSGSVRSIDVSTVREQLNEIRQQCINYLIDLLFPERRRSLWGSGSQTGSSRSYSDGSSGSEGAGSSGSVLDGFESDNAASVSGVNVKTFIFSNQYYHEETEVTGFSTQGTVKCADGREINFNLNLEMSRSFQEYYEENVSMRQASLCDPLVINLNGNIADLSDQTFLFDLDGDGEEDEINRLASGSGFLALDKNGDGIINDGTELFGTKSGDGFADLAAYDTDNNGFIDEGDEIWNQLKIWVTDENGEQKLYSLAEKGVGAICLQNAATNFAIKDENNETKGVIRKTGVFLYENGNAGTVQHVDLALHEQKKQEEIRRNQSKYEKWLYDMAM